MVTEIMTEEGRQALLAEKGDFFRDWLNSQKGADAKNHRDPVVGFIVHPTKQNYYRPEEPRFFYLRQGNVRQHAYPEAKPPVGRGEYMYFYYYSIDDIINRGKTLETIW